MIFVFLHYTQDGESHINDNCSRRYTCNNTELITEAHSCSVDASCDERDGVRNCYCNDGYYGDGVTCIRRDCYDIFNGGATVDGIYTIYPTGWESTGFQVYCEMSTDGGGWTVFQRRSTTNEGFSQGWAQYKAGFGDVNYDHWLGNDKLNALTNQGTYQLRVDLRYTAGVGVWYYALYTNFSIGNETDKYRLTLGTYSGTAGS
ncbi:putative ryncolin-1-like [Apostichopus japonicus]|uniref:Putative ryncolin-1-like n=1 Tax=Stichopus japonicus TaxID=307972 RepID=A0A2G8JSW3_STIJA|nr:putative ryncolin-1-like [Apostichopus japonicus]